MTIKNLLENIYSLFDKRIISNDFHVVIKINKKILKPTFKVDISPDKKSYMLIITTNNKY